MKISKKIDLIELISKTLENNQFETVFNVPGYGGSEVMSLLAKNKQVKTFINLNEEAAFSISYGVSSNGKRSALLIKSQGFVKAMNAITSSMSTETTSANIVFVFDDTEGKSSDNILPTQNIVKSSEIPFIVIGKDASSDIVKGIEISEKLKVSVAIIVDCKKLKNLYINKITTIFAKKLKTPKFEDRVACPVLTGYQREKLKIKLSNKKKKISPPKILDIRKVLPPTLCSELLKYEKFMNILKRHRPSFIAGDAGTSALFAFAPFKCVDSCTYMGGGPGMALGAMLAGREDAICVTGDFSFLAAGILGFNEAIFHKIPLKVIIFNNGKAHATGGQELNPDLMNNFKKTFKDNLFELTPGKSTDSKIESTLLHFLKSKKLSILILDI